MGRCGCDKECYCAVIGSDCVAVVGTGTVSSPYQVSPIISPDPDNILACANDGLLVEPPVVATLDTTCIELGGTGQAATPLFANPVISGDATNVLECRASGLFVPPVGAGLMPRATIEMVNSQPIPPSAGAGIPSTQEVEYDNIVEDTDGFTTLSGGGSFEFTIPVGLGGYYLLGMQERDSPNAINLGTSVGIQIKVNGVVEASQRFERSYATQKILNANRQITLIDGDVITGFFNITSTFGPTAPHVIGPGGAGFPRFLQLVRLSPP